MSDSSRSSDSSNDELENGEQSGQQQPQQSGQFGDSSSMSSSTSSSDDEEQQNQPSGVDIGQQSEQQEVGSGAESRNAENFGKDADGHETGEEEVQKEATTEDEEEEDGIFTTKDDEEEGQGREEGGGISEADEGGGEHGNQEEEDEEEEDHREDTARVIERMEVSDDEEAEEVVDTGPIKIDLDMARSKADLGEEGPYFVKLPNFLSIDTKPFDPETYDDELEEDDVLDDEGRTRLKLKMENTIRWRIVRDEQGNEKRESNARFVRWSDGSMSMYLGGEVFEVDKQRIMDFNHLYIRQGAALQAQSVFAEKLVFRPHSTDTLTHRKMTMNMAEKTSKAQKVRMLANVGDNPDAQKKEMIRLEEEKLRAAARREAQQRRVRERPRAMGLTSGFLEGYESDEGGAESLAAIKRRYQHAPYGVGGGRASADRERSYYSESDEDREERRQRKTINEAKIDSDEEEEEGGEEMETSDTEQRQTPHKSQSREQQKKKIVIEEDEDE